MELPQARNPLAALLGILAIAAAGCGAAATPRPLATRASPNVLAAIGPASAGRRLAPVAPGPAPATRPVDVVIAAGRGGHRVPEGFVGLSFETSELPRVASFAGRGNVVALLRAIPDGLMRFGGITSDTVTAWSNGGAAPAWAHTVLTSAVLHQLARLAQETGWRVQLTVNLGRYSPSTAAAEVRSARRQLGSRLAAIEIGNEPDRFVRENLRKSGWTLADYLREVAAYRAAITRAVPGVTLIGPGVSSGPGPLPWIGAYGGAIHPQLLSDHYYPDTACAHTATIAELLSSTTHSAETQMLGALAGISRAAGTPLRLDETNNVSCHGMPGVSDSFASALWAVDFGLRAIASRLSGLNFHDLIAEPRSYGPLVATSGRALAAGQLQANPEWYALLLLSRLEGDRALGARSGYAGLETAAFATPRGRVQLVLIDDDAPGARPLMVRLQPPAGLRKGTILRLHAGSLAALSGVTLGGRAAAPDGTWKPAPLPHLLPHGRALELAMTAGGAALVTLAP